MSSRKPALVAGAPELGISPEVARFLGPYWRELEGKKPVYRVSRDGARFFLFCARLLRHTKGRWAGEPVLLEPWELFSFSELLRAATELEDGSFIELGPKDVLDPALALERGLQALSVEPRRPRVYKEGYFQISKKNGKSLIASAFALFALVADEELGAEVYGAASAKDQARIVFGQAQKMVRASPMLARFVKVFRDAIEVPELGNVFRVISADAGTNEGLEPSHYVCDELHRHKSRELLDTLSKGTVARARPLGLIITNAGADLDTVCGELYEQAKAVRDRKPGRRKDLYPFVPELADEDLDPPANWKPSDPVPRKTLERWAAVNPASWITPEVLEGEYRKSPVYVFRRFNLNRWTRAEKAWLPAGAWEACRGELHREAWEGGFAAVDLGSSHDSTGVAVVLPVGTRGGKLVAEVVGTVLQAHSDPDQPPPAAHEVIEGDSVPIALVEAEVLGYAADVDLEEVAFDPWRFARSAELLADQGIEMVEFPQTNERMCPASQALFDAIVEGRLLHDGDPILTAHIEAAVPVDTERGWRLKKLRSRKPQDFAIALAIAWARAEASLDGGASPSISGLA